jgi:NitT/TauT family transport system substrate-binding protein
VIEKDGSRDTVSPLSRRTFLQQLCAGLAISSGLAGCSRYEPLLRIGTNVWPGYEFFYVAAARSLISADRIRMMAMPSATACIHALAAGTIEGAGLTLDEVLTARAEGIDLKVVAILDISMGADVLLANPSIATLQALRGKTIGVEQSAVGAVMLAAVLESAGLQREEVKILHLNVNQHLAAYESQRVDALITFEPVRSQLQGRGLVQLFDSSLIPGRIVDVLAVRSDAIRRSPRAIGELISAHFKLRNEFMLNPEPIAEVMMRRLRLAPIEVIDSFKGIDLPDLARNLKMLRGTPPEMERNAFELVQVMNSAGLLPRQISVRDLFDPRFIEPLV